MNKELYEKNYKNSKHFSFGKNWQNFIKTLNYEKINEAKKSLIEFLNGEENIRGKTFIDVGCGSGLFSLAAFNLGAARVVSMDVDEFSVACATYLRKKEASPNNWEIKQGSALDDNFIKSLGQFDIVYSWGVLHHTGNMFKAFDNVANMILSGGNFYLAIYNKNTKYKSEGTSKFWLKAKKFYNKSNFITKKIMEIIYSIYFVFGLLFNFKNPIKYIKNYSTLRGMNFFTDIKDWLGGYPYECASVQEIVDYFKRYNLKCEKYKEVRSIGCNEFLFSRE